MTGQRDQLELSLEQCATLACMLEVTTPKPGNVHRGADFEDVTLNDFMASAVAAGPVLAGAARRGVGATVLEAIRATQTVTRSNTNLGTVLLLAPLAAVPRSRPLREGIGEVLGGLGAADARHVYEAIRLAEPGGLGDVAEMDVKDDPPDNLLNAMRAAAHRDLVAAQYTNGFAQVLDEIAPALVAWRNAARSLAQAIIRVHVETMARHPDSLIARKCSPELAEKSARLAAAAVAAGRPGEEDYYRAVEDLDFWLRSDGHRRNPGTTADLIAAGLFAALREGLLEPPFF